MKIFTKMILVAALGGVFGGAAVAGPGPQYWNRSSSAPVSKATKAANDGTVVACDHMLIRSTGPGSDRVPFASVSCSPELLRTNAQCQSECGVAASPKTEPTGLACTHMLIRNTGPGRGSSGWISVNCTPEMMAANPECQSACHS